MTGFRAREISVTKPSVARMYDYFLGGTHNYAIDRIKAAEVEEQAPGINLRHAARDNRAFLGRAVQHCVNAGIRQILDLGSGIPTVRNVHEVAHALDPSARVVYVDYEDEAVVTAKEILEDIDTATIIGADILDPELVLSHPDTRRLIDFTQPVALLMVAVLHFVPRSKNAHGLVQTYAQHLPPGSYLAISHAATEGQEQYRHLYDDTNNPVTLRNRQEITELFEGFTILKPGIVMAPDWPQPQAIESDSTRFGNWAGVGLRPQ